MSRVREPRRRKDAGLRKYIVQFYTKPIYRFLYNEETEPLKHLIFGLTTRPPMGTGARAIWDQRAEALRPLWLELREDILKAQAEFSPAGKPWGARFDNYLESPVAKI